jgi:transcription antitermination protein NusB
MAQVVAVAMAEPTTPPEPRPPGGGARRRGVAGRRAARIGAVQALYQIDVANAPVHEVLAEFQAHRLDNLFEPLEGEPGPAPEVDRAWFVRVVRGAAEFAPELDPLIADCLAQGWTLRRLGYALRACLRAGAFELARCPEVPARVAINEYIEVAHAFFHGDEPRFVNAVLDRLSKQLRPEETK